MLRNIILALFTIAAISVSASAVAQRPYAGGTYFTVEMMVQLDGQTIGTPRLIMRTDRPAVITVPSVDGYALRADLGMEMIQGQRRARLSLDLRLPHEDRWVGASAPTLTLPLGRDGTFTVPAERSRVGRAIHLQYRVVEGVVGASLDSERGGHCTEANIAAWESRMAAPVSAMVRPAAAAIQSGGAGSINPGGENCCQGPGFTCCGESACCSDPWNCIGSCCTG